jgi:WD40 repeat protein
MRVIRVFISSPGDVAEERDRAKSVVEELRRRYAGRLDLQAVLWEDLPLQADMSFQQGIDLVLSERGVDIAVFILWSRLGSPLGALVRRPDGAEYRSGTEREWDLIWRARARSGGERPMVIAYTRRDESSFDERLRGLPTQEKDSLLQQKKRVEQFIAEEFHASGANIRAYHSFDRPTTFAQRLRVHLQEMLDPLVSGDLPNPVWNIEKSGPPFLGLDAFEFEHAPVFFGREDEIVAVRQLLREQARRGCAFVLVTGSSGSGKSSLVRAGVLPAIAAHEVDGDVAGWRAAILTPAEGDGDLMLTLARALSAERALPALGGHPGGIAQLAADLTRDPEMFCRRVLRPDLKSGGRNQRLLVFVDQLEELFADRRMTAEARESFANALEALARSGCVWVLATVRSDFYAQCQSLGALVRMKEGGGQFDLIPPGADALERLIRQPAALAGLRFEQHGDKSLADVILSDAAAHRELLPLLEYLLHRLCAERTADGMLKFSSYDALGGVEGALASRARTVIAELRPTEAAVDALLAALVTVSGDEQESFVRRRAARAELERDDASRALIATLIRERLLTSNAPPDGPATVSVAHEALFRVWDYAVAWLERNREFLRLRANVTPSFGRWRSANEHHSLLLPSGLPLEEAGRLLAIEAGRLESPMRSYIETSITYRKTQEKRSLHVRRTVMAALSFLTLAAALLAANAFSQRDIEKKRAAEQRESLDRASRFEQDIAEQSFRDGDWHKGVAHLGRSLQLNPQNRAAAERLWRTVVKEGSAQVHEPLGPALGHENFVMSVDFSPDGSRIVTASWDQTAQVWNTCTGEPVGAPLRHDGRIWTASFSSDGSRVVTASADRTARIWDATSGDKLVELRHEDEINSASFSPDGSRVVTASDDGTARIWEARTGQQMRVLQGHGKSVNTASFSPDGDRLVTAGDDETARIWDAQTGEQLTPPLRHTGKVNGASFSPDGARVITASDDNSAQIWDARTGSPLGKPLTHADRVNTAVFSPDGTRAVTASRDNTARIWDAATGNPQSQVLKHAGWVTCARFSPDGFRVLTASADKTARIWDTESGKSLGEPLRHESEILDARFSPDGSCAATASKDKTARVWDVHAGAPYGDFLRHGDRVAAARFSDDDARIVTASWDGTARIWSGRGLEPLGEPLHHEGRVVSARFSRDGLRVVTASWDRTAKIWDARNGRLLQTLSHEGQLHSAEFSKDGFRVVTASADKSAQVWNADTGERIGKPLLHKGWVMTASFSPDGATVLTASWDKTAGSGLLKPASCSTN